jgi:hypothetical protein
MEMKFIDLDDETAVAVGRARLASATAYGSLITNRVISPPEARKQIVADGLFTISIPEEVDEKEFDILPAPTGAFGSSKSSERPGMLGKPISPSQGGYGEVRSLLDVALADPEFKAVFDELEEKWDDLDEESRQDATKELQEFMQELKKSAVGLDVLLNSDDNSE